MRREVWASQIWNLCSMDSTPEPPGCSPERETTFLRLH